MQYDDYIIVIPGNSCNGGIVTESFNFDEWSSLAKMAPDEFENQRHCAIEKVIANGTNVRRLRGLQCRIDLERARARTPLNACLRLSSLMWESFDQCRGELNRFALIVGGAHRARASQPRTSTSAKIIPFGRPVKS